MPTGQAPGGGPNVGANAPTNFPTYNGTPIVTLPPVPGTSNPTGQVPPAITLPPSPTAASTVQPTSPSAAESAPNSADKSVVISTGSGTPLSLRIPFSDTVSEVDTTGPGRLFTGLDVEVATDSAGENTQIAVTLKTAAAPQSIPLTLDLPQGWVLRPRDGAVTEIFNGSGDREALLTTEKFTDATGALLPASQTVDGGTVTVHTDTSAGRFPYRATMFAGKSGCSCEGGTGPGSARYENTTSNPWYGEDPYLSNISQQIADWTVAETFVQNTDNADGHRDRIRDVVRWSLESSADAGESHDKAEDKAKAAAAAELEEIWAEEQQRRAAAAAAGEKYLALAEPAREARSAVLTAGAPGAGKSTSLSEHVDEIEGYRQIDSDDIKDYLLQQALVDGIYDDLLERKLADGYPISPRELATLVHRGSTNIVADIRSRCISRRENLIIEGTLTWAEEGVRIVEQLSSAGYVNVHIIDVEVPFDVAAEQALSLVGCTRS
nr:zeta toxin family protein [Rhodococcus qingshengii]